MQQVKNRSQVKSSKSRVSKSFHYYLNGVYYVMYKILKSDSPQKLEFEVQKYLKNGWSVAGGVAVSPDSIYFQAVINSTKIKLHTKKQK